MELHRYNIIYADPPWQYENDLDNMPDIGGCSYPLMSLDEIKSLPIQYIAAKDSLLFLWVTMPKLIEGLEVVKAWGFKYRTCAFTWVKLNSDNMGIYSGLGHWTNGNAELCLLGKRGNPARVQKNIKQIVLAPVLEHSHKPPEVRERIVALAGDLPRIELFARHKVEGWDVWGNEISNDIDLIEIRELV